MSNESKTQRGAWLTKISAIGKYIIAPLALVIGSGVLYFGYENFVNVPDVVYTILPTYELEGQSIGALVVENRGRATAHQVRVSLGDLGTAIVQRSVESQEGWREEGGGIGEATLVLWLDRMASGSSVTTYLVTQEAAQWDGLAVTTEEGPGHVASVQSTPNPGALVLSAAVLGALIVSVVWFYFYSQRMAEMTSWRHVAESGLDTAEGWKSTAEDWQGLAGEWKALLTEAMSELRHIIESLK